MKAKHSKTDDKGHVYVDCSECDRGGNGQAKDKCACGWKVKRAKRGGCYLGTLRDGLSVATSAAPSSGTLRRMKRLK